MKNSLIFLMTFCVFILVMIPQIFAKQTFFLQETSWSRVGKVYLTRPSSHNAYESDYSNHLGILYESFDGERLRYKIYVSADDRFYFVEQNPSYSKSKVDYCNEMNNKSDHFRGPWPKISEQYPQRAGSYYLDISNVFDSKPTPSTKTSWTRVGKVYLTRPSSDNAYKSDYSNHLGILYESFDGEKLSYKIYVSADDCFYSVEQNPSYSKSKVDYCNEMNNKSDHFRGPWPKISEQYPQRAGSYYLDVNNVF